MTIKNYSARIRDDQKDWDYSVQASNGKAARMLARIGAQSFTAWTGSICS